MSYFVDQLNEQLRSSMRGLPQAGFLHSLDTEAAATQLARQEESWIVPENGPIILNYAFMKDDHFPGYDPDVSDFTPLSAQQRDGARLAMQTWSDVTNVQFQEEDEGPADIFIGNAHLNNIEGGITWNYSAPDSHLFSANIWLTPSPLDSLPGNYPFHVMVHEIGHALGLAHPGNYDIQDEYIPSYNLDAAYLEDNSLYTSMSYWSEAYGGGDFGGTYTAGPMMDDITAIQRIYGANSHAFAGNTTYGFNSNTDRDIYTFTSPDDKKAFCIYDSGGNDNLDVSGFTQDQIIDLRPGAFSNVGGLLKNVSIAENTTIENILSGSGNDILIGNDASNFIFAGDGDDIIYGGLGADVLSGGGGSNVFVYLDIRDSTPSAADCIMDFKQGIDRIDLSAIVDHMNTTIHADYNTEYNVTDLWANTDGPEQFLIHITGQIDLQTDLLID